MDFGDYCYIEQKRYGVPNEMYVHKVIGRLRSNTFVDVPMSTPPEEVIHDQFADVLRVVCCGVDETKVFKVRIQDVKKDNNTPKQNVSKGGVGTKPKIERPAPQGQRTFEFISGLNRILNDD